MIISLKVDFLIVVMEVRSSRIIFLRNIKVIFLRNYFKKIIINLLFYV